MIANFGQMPMELPKGHFLLNRLFHFLRRPPKEYKPKTAGINDLVITIPYNDEKNVLYNFYLSSLCEKCYLKSIKNFFHLTFVEDMNESRLSGLNIKDSIYVFIDKYDLGAQAFEALDKYYQRYSSKKRVYAHRKRKYNKSSVKRRFCPTS